MADLTTWPTWEDVRNKLMSASFWPTDTNKQALAQEQAEIAVASVVAEFERRTGWMPFLADAVAGTWYFDNTDAYGELAFDGGFVTISSLTINGTLQTLNTNYTTEPRNAVNLGQPITRINMVHGGFRTGYPTTPNNIVVVGRRGYTTTLPADVWQAVQEMAALVALTSVENLQSIASISMDGFSKAFDVVGVITQKDLLTSWGKKFDVKVQQYMRVVV